jgi:hypothetical protein
MPTSGIIYKTLIEESKFYLMLEMKFSWVMTRVRRECYGQCFCPRRQSSLPDMAGDTGVHFLEKFPELRKFSS